MSLQARHSYEFGPFRLDAAERMLLRGAEIVPLTPRVFDVLALLVERNGHLLERKSCCARYGPIALSKKPISQYAFLRLGRRWANNPTAINISRPCRSEAIALLPM